MRTEPVRIESDRVQKVREIVATTGQTISGFIALAIDEKIEQSKGPWCGDPGLELPPEYRSGLAQVGDRGPEVGNGIYHRIDFIKYAFNAYIKTEDDTSK